MFVKDDDDDECSLTSVGHVTSISMRTRADYRPTTNSNMPVRFVFVHQ
jgi:hypothetical protein